MSELDGQDVIMTETIQDKPVPETNLVSNTDPARKVDIEHAHVENDPRKWSRARKTVILVIVSGASLIATLGANIYNPSIHEIEVDLNASSADISLSLSLFILLQGCVPLIWSAVSEIKGRKVVYLVSISLYVVGCICVATAKTIAVLIGMRCIQASGSSAVIGIGAATLADIYEPSERGSMMGVYYAAPLLGPSIGPILGGGLTQGFNWRASFWFLAIFGGVNFVSFLFFFNDTFRRERSLAYQAVLRKRNQERELAVLSSSKKSSQTTVINPVNNEKGTPANLPVADARSPEVLGSKDEETQDGQAAAPPLKDISLSLTDVNPIPPLRLVLRRWNNIAILIASGLIFAFSYSITYTCSRALSSIYGYNALKIGLVLLSYGIGSVSGSVLGGRWSDRVLRRLKAKNGGQTNPEMRLESTRVAMIVFPLSVVAYGWLCQKHVHIATVCVALFLAGFSSIWIYSSTLAYIVDANMGRSSTAVACNSMFRGTFAFIATEVAVPLDDAIGEGGLYTLWAGLVIVTELLILLVWWRGGRWRAVAEAREKTRRQ